jgi:hypothetical protein
MGLRYWFLAPLLGGVFLAMVACQNAPPPAPQFAELHFSAPPISLDVARIAVVPVALPPSMAPHIEDRLPVSLARATENWATDRLRAAGSHGVAVVTVNDVSAVGESLQKQQGFSAQFTTQADTRYQLHASITVEIRDDRGFALRTVRAEAERTHTTLEDITLDQRDRELYELERALMADLDQRLEAEIRRNFAGFIR